jgi:RsiW-degrading membrane proteinase PrsW (M82 family)
VTCDNSNRSQFPMDFYYYLLALTVILLALLLESIRQAHTPTAIPLGIIVLFCTGLIVSGQTAILENFFMMFWFDKSEERHQMVMPKLEQILPRKEEDVLGKWVLNEDEVIEIDEEEEEVNAS